MATENKQYPAGSPSGPRALVTCWFRWCSGKFHDAKPAAIHNFYGKSVHLYTKYENAHKIIYDLFTCARANLKYN